MGMSVLLSISFRCNLFWTQTSGVESPCQTPDTCICSSLVMKRLAQLKLKTTKFGFVARRAHVEAWCDMIPLYPCCPYRNVNAMWWRLAEKVRLLLTRNSSYAWKVDHCPLGSCKRGGLKAPYAESRILQTRYSERADRHSINIGDSRC